VEIFSKPSFDFNAFSEIAITWVVTSGLKILLIIIATLILKKIVRIFSRKIFTVVQKREDNSEFAKRADTLSSIVRHILNITIFVIAVMIILGELGIKIGPILAAAGVIGLAVGFGAQSLVKDVISGFFILLEDQIRVGDVIIVAGRAGLVEKLNLRLTTLRDLEGRVHYVPNGQIDVVTNMTKEYSCYVFDIGVAYKEDVDQVINLIREVGKSLREDPDFHNCIIEDMEVFGLDKFADSALIVKARIKTKPMRQWDVAREFNRRLKIKFDENDVEIPFPHLTMFMGQDKDGYSPPMNLNLYDNRKTSNKPIGPPEKPLGSLDE
jgi:small conductance mechanosensitive channel